MRRPSLRTPLVAAVAAGLLLAADSSAATPAAPSAPSVLAAAAARSERVPAFTLQLATLTTSPGLASSLHNVTQGVVERTPAGAADVSVDMGRKVRDATGTMVPARYRAIVLGAGAQETMWLTGVPFERLLTSGVPWGKVRSGALEARSIFVRDRLIPGADAAAWTTLLRVPGAKAKRVEKVTAKGVTAVHYQVTVDVKALLRGDGIGRAAAEHLQFLYPPRLATDTYDVWIDSKGIVRQLLFVFPLDQGATFRMDVSLTPLAKAPVLRAPASALVQDVTESYAKG